MPCTASAAVVLRYRLLMEKKKKITPQMKITLKDRTLEQGHINGAAKTQRWTL